MHTVDFSQSFDLGSVWNGPEMQHLRRIISSGHSEGTGCHGCQWLRYSTKPQFVENIPNITALPENSSSPIDRNWNRALENYNARSIEVDSYPVKYYLNFGLACNIRCIMCSQTHMRDADKQTLPVEPLLRMKPYLVQADQIHIIGGEPLLIPSAREFLQHMFADTAFSQTMLSLYTNGTLLHQYLDKFRSLSRINVCVSLDSIGRGYEHIRRGARWVQTEKNLLDYKELGAKLSLDWQATAACIIMKSSIETLDKFVEWCVAHEIPCHFAPLSYIDIADDEDVFRFPALLDQIPGWQDIFDRAIVMLMKKGWDIGRAEGLRAMKQELLTAHNAYKAKEKIEQMITVAMSRGVSLETEFRGYITKAQGLAEIGQFERLTVFCDQIMGQIEKPADVSPTATTCTPASAYWNQRNLLASCKQRLSDLSDAVNHQSDLNLYQWAQIAAMTLEFKPDLIIELGRGRGNSTCIFTESANLLGGKSACQVTSLCLSFDFVSEVIPRLLERKLVSRSWFAPLDCWHTDILAFDYESLLKDKKRVLVFWDAHGFEVAGCMLGRILPQLVDKQHMVLMHDMSDQRYLGRESLSYNGERLWRGNNWEGPRVVLGNINSAVEQAVSISDFSARNGFELLSADHSNHTELKPYPEKTREMQRLLGDDFFQLQGHWFCFSLNNYKGPFTFPRYEAPKKYLTDEQLELLHELHLK